MTSGMSLAKVFLRIGQTFKSSAIPAMVPDSLIHISLESYKQSDNIAIGSNRRLIDQGLSHDEKELLHRLPFRDGESLLDGIGAGCEVLDLARCGFRKPGDDLSAEWTSAGFKIKYFTLYSGGARGGAILEKDRTKQAVFYAHAT
jgi:hypothetical protein